MKKIHFRCVKITQEEKRTNTYGERETVMRAIVDVQFCLAETDCLDILPTNGYLGLSLTKEQFQELGYEVGKVYELSPM